MAKELSENPIPATWAQNNFGACLKKAIGTAMPVVIGKHGKPVAVILDFSTWTEIKSRRSATTREDHWIMDCRQFVAKLRAKKRRTTSSVELLRELREER